MRVALLYFILFYFICFCFWFIPRVSLTWNQQNLEDWSEYHWCGCIWKPFCPQDNRLVSQQAHCDNNPQFCAVECSISSVRCSFSKLVWVSDLLNTGFFMIINWNPLTVISFFPLELFRLCTFFEIITIDFFLNSFDFAEIYPTTNLPMINCLFLS